MNFFRLYFILRCNGCILIQFEIYIIIYLLAELYCIKFNECYSSENYENLCRKYNIPPLSNRRSYHDMLFLYKIYNSSYDTPELLSNLNLRVPSFNSREKSLFYNPTSRVNASKNSCLRRITRNFDILTQNDNSIDLSFPMKKFQRSLRACLY